MLGNLSESIKSVTAVVKKINKALSVVALIVGVLYVSIKMRNILNFKHRDN